jgi:glycosyltransferase involved in cell wall biosynthesis
MVHGSDVVITICQELQDAVAHMGAGERALLIENVMGGEVEDLPSIGAADIRGRWQIPAAAPLVLYTGTFEAYQGLELLTHAAARLAGTHPQARILVVGGEPAQVEQALKQAAAIGAAEVMTFTGQQPARDIPSYVQACDILVSPRIRGTNTPLKIYSYLRSGKPIVATALVTHTQVLSSNVARLVAPEPEPFAAAVGDLIERPEEGKRRASAAARLAAGAYSREVYVRRTAEAYARLGRGGSRAANASRDCRGASGAEGASGALGVEGEAPKSESMRGARPDRVGE